MRNIAIITGASSGFGQEFVLQLAQKYPGFDQIWAIARRRDRLEQLAKIVKCKTGVTVVPIVMDLLDLGRMGELEIMLRQEKVAVRILVNCAGFGKIGMVQDQNIQDLINMVHLNCESLTAVTKTVLPFMSSKSRIIQVASTAAYLPQPGFSVYAATKSYVYSFSKSLNEELRSRKITVTAVCPGPANTEFFQVAASEKEEPFYKKFFLADPKKVVKKAIKDCSRGRNESTYGVAMKLVKIMSKLVPNNWIIRVIGWMQEVTS
ncbi:NADP-dependent 3-hydroxy acid dehydrogenase YdfG [Clostridiales bacterium CHKCI001]|nr:NADP-dependent 3-hydroxy acid dehydrogenase YdfG [Clostridiales bacterium CHKCI001]